MKSYKEYDLLSPLKLTEADQYVRAEGAAFYDKDENCFVDMNEMRLVLGQGNKEFEAAMAEAFQGCTSLTGNMTCYKERLYQYFDETTDGYFEAAHLTASGSEAVECAVRLAKKMTGSTEVFSFWNSIHGRTYLSGSMSGLPKRKKGYGPLASGVIHLPYPDCAACKARKVNGECTQECMQMAEGIYKMASAQDAAAVIVEPYQGAEIRIPPVGYLKRLQDWAHEKGMLFIVDEIQTGMGRTGEMYCYQKEKLEPDILLLGKALGNGMHIAAVLVKERPPEEALPALSGGAGDDPVACAAACEVYRQLEQGLLTHIQKAGACLQTGIRRFRDHARIRECRGIGLVAAIEFYEEEYCRQVFQALKKKGYLVGHTGKILYFKPPYVIMEEQIQGFLENFAIITKELGE
ncbi:aspartate aminotransferase family protein [Roseburia hominis]